MKKLMILPINACMIKAAVDEVMQVIHDCEDFKRNCNLIILDFLFRHDLLNPQEKDYTDLVSSLHKQL